MKKRLNVKIRLDSNMDADDYGARLMDLTNRLTNNTKIIVEFGAGVSESECKYLFNHLLDDLKELGIENKIVACATSQY